MIKHALNIAIPKGRLTEKIFSLFEQHGMNVPDVNRSLVIALPSFHLNILLVKNTDLTTYVSNGIASLGIVGSDLLFESNESFYSLATFPFGKTRICLIAKKETVPIDEVTRSTIATKYQNFAHRFVLERNLKVKVIPLHGSLELAPLLGLAPYIIDLVETGQTIQENGLVVQEVLGSTDVKLIANPALYKYYHKEIAVFMRRLKL